MKRYLLLLLLPILAFANIGKITVLKGDVSITRGTKTLNAKIGSTLEKNDFIKTAKNAKVQIIFTDKTIFTIGKNSTLDIADYLYDESKPSKNKAKFNVLKGAFTSITGRIGKLNKSKFKLRTKSASIGIRGTVVKADQEVIMCTQGGITVTMFNGQSIDVGAGNKVSVKGNKLGKPQKIQAGDEAKMGADVTKKDKEESRKQQQSKNSKNSKKSQQKKQSNDSDVQDSQNSDKINNKIDKIVSTIKHGRSMSSGTANSDFNVKVVDSKATLSDGTELRIKDSDGATSWGYWDNGAGADDYAKTWVAGTKTTTSYMDKVINSGSKTNYTYTGQVIGQTGNGSGGTNAIRVDGDNEVKINFDLGGGSNSLAGGSIKFKNTGNEAWNSTINAGTSTNSGFSSTMTGGSGNGEAINSGNIDGNFYGTSAQQVGGSFDMKAGANTASGVFKATK